MGTYGYALVYVDDVMLLSSNVDLIIGELKEHFTLKVVEDPSVKPCRYLGGMIGQYTHEDGSTSWYISADDYLSKALPTVEEEWKEKLQKRVSSPLPHEYHPELDVSPLLTKAYASLYASYIGILQWAVELARVDLTQLVALMSRFWSVPLVSSGTSSHILSWFWNGSIGIGGTSIGPRGLIGRSSTRVRQRRFPREHRSHLVGRCS
jgi:hypothetical protein